MSALWSPVSKPEGNKQKVFTTSPSQWWQPCPYRAIPESPVPLVFTHGLATCTLMTKQQRCAKWMFTKSEWQLTDSKVPSSSLGMWKAILDIDPGLWQYPLLQHGVNLHHAYLRTMVLPRTVEPMLRTSLRLRHSRLKAFSNPLQLRNHQNPFSTYVQEKTPENKSHQAEQCPGFLSIPSDIWEAHSTSLLS